MLVDLIEAALGRPDGYPCVALEHFTHRQSKKWILAKLRRDNHTSSPKEFCGSLRFGRIRVDELISVCLRGNIHVVDDVLCRGGMKIVDNLMRLDTKPLHANVNNAKGRSGPTYISKLGDDAVFCGVIGRGSARELALALLGRLVVVVMEV
jgi:hypothetical protein